MNKYTLSVLLFICFCMGLFACTKTKDTTTPVGTVSALITANKWETGNTWICNSAAVSAQFGNTASGFTKILAIGGTRTSGTAPYGYLVMFINNYKDSADRFVLDNVNNTAAYLTISGSDTTIHKIAYGLINITSGTAKAAQGVFDFTCTDSVKVSNGVFNVVIH